MLIIQREKQKAQKLKVNWIVSLRLVCNPLDTSPHLTIAPTVKGNGFYDLEFGDTFKDRVFVIPRWPEIHLVIPAGLKFRNFYLIFPGIGLVGRPADLACINVLFPCLYRNMYIYKTIIRYFATNVPYH